MAIAKIIPSQTSILTKDDELEFFHDILCLWEGSNKNPDCINFSDKRLGNYLSANGLKLPHDKRGDSITIEQSIPNQIQFKGSRPLCRTFIRHLRNAFAHNLIERKIVQTQPDNGDVGTSAEYLHFQDWRLGYCRMDGLMRYDDLKNLIKLILKR